MFYEEKMLNGVMCYRTSPHDKFRPYTLKELSARYETAMVQVGTYSRRVHVAEQVLRGEVTL